ncbi:MAG TPA: FecR family protein [bacterium]|jgi:hypothetical protein|nr:FecR family protein [bacterium]
MKKLLILITLLLVLAALTFKRNPKPAETEMALPTPVATPTMIAASSPTTALAMIFTPTPEPTVMEYSIEDIKGTALIMPFDSTVPETAVEGEAVEAGDEVITKDDSEMTLALNNNTLVHVEANSQVKVSDLAPNTSHGFTSRLELLIGNVLSEVEKLNESKSSFEIDAGGVVCAVRGTGFEVQKQGDSVVTNTFHGTVEMQKNGHVQNVGADQHSTFSLKRAGFLPQRHLNLSEKKHYQTWTRIKATVQQKRQNRLSYPMDLSRKPVRSPQRNAAKAPNTLAKPRGPVKGKDNPKTKANLKRPEKKRPLVKKPLAKPKRVQPETKKIKPKPKTTQPRPKPRTQQKVSPAQNQIKPQTRIKPNRPQPKPNKPAQKNKKKKKV